MTVFAYLRISDATKQTTKNQEFIVKEYAREHNLLLEPKNIFVHKISGSKSSQSERGWDDIVKRLNEGDTLLVPDVDRMGRDRATGIIALIDSIIMRGADLIFCRSNTIFNMDCHSDPGKFFMLMGKAYAAVEFAKERSRKAKAAAALRSKNNLTNGRAKGEFVASKLDASEAEIILAISNGEPKSGIAKRFGVGRNTLYIWIKTRDEALKKAKEIGVQTSGKNIGDIKKAIREMARKNQNN